MIRNPFLKTTLCLLLFACIAPSCKKDGTTSAPVEPPANNFINARLWNMGFDTSSVRAFKDGYLVENCIYITEAQIKNEEGNKEDILLRLAETEQYRATVVVTGIPRVINVKHSGTPTTFYLNAMQEMVGRYNALRLNVTFAYNAAGTANVTMIPYYGTAPTDPAAYADYPVAGQPGATIHYNTYQLDGLGMPLVASVLQHEMGHALGLRHTDYMHRNSCPLAFQGNEGAGPVGVVHIPGTPTTTEPESFMLACFNTSIPSRTFTDNDIRALAYLFNISQDPGSQNIYTFHNSSHKDDILSANGNCQNIFPGWNYNGTSFRAFITSATPGTVPVYEYYNAVDRDHTYSINNNDPTILSIPNWVQNNPSPIFYVYTSSFTGAVPVYAYYNASEKRHIFTSINNIHLQYPGWSTPYVAWYGVN